MDDTQDVLKVKFTVVSKQQYQKALSVTLESNDMPHQQLVYILPKTIWLRARIGDEITIDLSFPHPE